jgi:hypothetical protein
MRTIFIQIKKNDYTTAINLNEKKLLLKIRIRK